MRREMNPSMYRRHSSGAGEAGSARARRAEHSVIGFDQSQRLQIPSVERMHLVQCPPGEASGLLDFVQPVGGRPA